MGHPEAAARRIAALRDIAVLELTPLAWLLALEILGEGGLPATEYIDAAHVALAAAHGVDVLLTWNCAHMANPAARSKLALVCEARGLSLPSLVTPAELSKE